MTLSIGASGGGGSLGPGGLAGVGIADFQIGPGSGAGLGPGGGTTALLSFMADGSSWPWVKPQTPSAYYVSSTNTTWFFWEGWQQIFATNQRVVEVATYNHTTKVWSGNYIVSIVTLTNDLHGTPTVTQDTAGYFYVFLGYHVSVPQVASTLNPNDPTAWQSSLYPEVVGAWVNPAVVGSTMYTFNAGNGAGTGLEESLHLYTATTSGGVPTWGSLTRLFDNTSGDQWFFIGGFAVSGTDIHFTWSIGPTIGAQSSDCYYGIYSTLDGSVRTYDGTTNVPAVSQPIGVATMANFKIATTLANDSGHTSLNIVGGTSHVIYHNALNLLHIANSGSGWSSPFTIWTYPATVTPFTNISQAVAVDNGSGGGVDVYFADGQFGLPIGGGNIQLITRSAAGSWGAASILQTFGAYQLNSPSIPAPAGGTPSTEAQVAWTETSSDGLVIAGNLQGFAYGSGNYLLRQAGYGLVIPAATTFDPAHSAAAITLSGGNWVATGSSSTNAISRSVSSKSAGLTFISFHVQVGTPGIGLCNSSQSVANTHFLGEAGNNSIGYTAGGNVRINNVIVATLGAFAAGKDVDVALDLTHNKVWFRVSGGAGWNNAAIGSQDPASNTGGTNIAAITGPLFAAMYSATINHSARMYAGQYPYRAQPPAGFSNWT